MVDKQHRTRFQTPDHHTAQKNRGGQRARMLRVSIGSIEPVLAALFADSGAAYASDSFAEGTQVFRHLLATPWP